jgi:hypothetical protein
MIDHSALLTLTETKIAAGTTFGAAALMGVGGVAGDMPFLQYGALGVLCLALILGYKVLQKINQDCHAHSVGREERLIQITKESQDHTDKLMVEVLTALRANKGD